MKIHARLPRFALCLALSFLIFTCAAAFAQAPPAQGSVPGFGAPAGDYAHMTMKVEKLADNFYTVVGINGNGRTGGTIGVLAGPDGILMVDSSYPQLTDKVVAAIRTFSNAPIRYLVNTHSHGEFAGGNPNFGKMGATILARPETRAALAGQRGFDPAGVPTITYTSPMTLYLDGEEVELIPVPPAHTNGDTMIYFHHANVVMTGDFFRTGYPNVGGTIDGMLAAIGMAIGISGPNTKVIPGHGAVNSRADLIAQRDLLATVRERIAAMIKQGKTEDEVLAAHPTAEFDAKNLSVRQYYDDASFVRFATPDAFVKQIYEQLNPKPRQGAAQQP